MGNPLDAMGRCIVCGKRCESTGGCDCSEVESYNHVPLKRVWKRTLVDADELAALQARLAEAEAQRAVLLGALEECRVKLRRAADGLAESNSACAARALRDIKPVEVEQNADADTCNAFWGERYGVDWVYSSPPDQPPSDLVALVKAVEKLKPHCDSAKRHGEWLDASGEIAWWGLLAALEALLTNQPGFRALIESEGI